jgi:7-cyano-7-deazaguanine reductase
MNAPRDSMLGRSVAHADRYDPGILFPIARALQRASIGIDGPLPFHGVDVWNAYELSWLDARGKPEIAIGEIRVPATTPNLVESKSLKLYLGSYAMERFASVDDVRARIAADLAAAAGGEVAVTLTLPDRFANLGIVPLVGESIDDLAVSIDEHGPPDNNLLRTSEDEADETLVSNLLKSNCPVTGQPDWASVAIRYRGARIDRESLLRYIVSFRNHADFHEHCVERMYVDLMRRCAPRRLCVYARYTRRGGIDINPWRSSEPGDPPNPRTVRQ